MTLNAQEMLTHMYNYSLEGNVVDHTWYKIFRRRKAKKSDDEPTVFGKPHLEAITLLSDIVYWYRPGITKRDDGTISLYKKFGADILQRSYDQIEEAFGISKREGVSAMETLEFFGVAKRVFRTITVNGRKVSNVMYISFDPIRLKELVVKYLEEVAKKQEEEERLKKVESSHVQTGHPSRLNGTHPTFKRETNTETSSETSTILSSKEERGGRPPSPPSRSKKERSSARKIERAKHVYTTDEEHQKLADEKSASARDTAYQVLSEWKEDTPRSKWKKSDFRSVKRWVFTAVDEKNGKPPPRKSNSNKCLSEEARSQYDGAF